MLVFAAADCFSTPLIKQCHRRMLRAKSGLALVNTERAREGSDEVDALVSVSTPTDIGYSLHSS